MTQARLDGPSAAAKLRVLKRDKFTCTYCGKAGTECELEVDHIHAVANGGSHHIGNLTTACRACNQAKGARKDMKPMKTQTQPQHNGGLVGLCLHTFAEDVETIEYQGCVIGVDGDMVLVQLYEWFMGEPTRVDAMPRSFIYSKRCRLYSCHEDMNEAYRAYNRRKQAVAQ